jgi:peptidoglycan/LPS O-acetylase OafA/YrhL
MDAIARGCLTAIISSRVKFSQRILEACAGAAAALLILILGFSLRANAWGLAQSGLDMTVLALGTCLVIIAAAQSRWRSPRVLLPLVKLGQLSYEVYLTHMFVVFALFDFFLTLGQPLGGVPLLFAGVILISGLVGAWVARFYSEPLNQWLRKRWGEGPRRLGAAVDTTSAA